MYINKLNEIVDGYINYLAYKELGYSKIPCVSVDNDFSIDSVIVREQLFNKQDGICYICGGNMILEDSEDDHYATIDHVIPRSVGGSFMLNNLKCACKICNSLKTNLPLTDSLKKKIKYAVSGGDA